MNGVAVGAEVWKCSDSDLELLVRDRSNLIVIYRMGGNAQMGVEYLLDRELLMILQKLRKGLPICVHPPHHLSG